MSTALLNTMWTANPEKRRVIVNQIIGQRYTEDFHKMTFIQLEEFWRTMPEHRDAIAAAIKAVGHTQLVADDKVTINQERDDPRDDMYSIGCVLKHITIDGVEYYDSIKIGKTRFCGVADVEIDPVIYADSLPIFEVMGSDTWRIDVLDLSQTCISEIGVLSDTTLYAPRSIEFLSIENVKVLGDLPNIRWLRIVTNDDTTSIRDCINWSTMTSLEVLNISYSGDFDWDLVVKTCPLVRLDITTQERHTIDLRGKPVKDVNVYGNTMILADQSTSVVYHDA